MARNYPNLRSRALKFLSDKLAELGPEAHPVDAYLSAAMRVFNTNNPELAAFAKNFAQTLRKTLSLQNYGMLVDQAPKPNGEINLAVPFWKQTDNYRDGNRTCFSSTMAMIVEYLAPQFLKNDDDYVKTVFSIGDTIYADVQVKALAKYGIVGTYRQDMGFDDLDAELAAGYPIGIAILHRGPADNPTGGHWLVIRGKTADGLAYYCNDPYGSIGDGYQGAVENGNNVQYSKAMLSKRWTVKGTGGWGMTCRKKS